MEFRLLGEEGLKVSAIGLGCNNLGTISEADARELLCGAVDLGINLFDTAEAYADGGSEETLGRCLAFRRSSVLIASKFGHPRSLHPGALAGSRGQIMRAVDGSLRRLRSDWIDLYQMHFPDPCSPIDEALRALDDLFRQGKIRAIGCCNFTGNQLNDALTLATTQQLNRFVSVQNPYSLLDRQFEVNTLPMAQKWGLGVLPSFPLAGGVLTGKYRELSYTARSIAGSTRSRVVPRFAERFLNARNLRLAGHLRAIAERHGWQLAELSIAWLLSNPSVRSVIAGATHRRQLEQNVRALTLGRVAKVVEIRRWRSLQD